MAEVTGPSALLANKAMALVIKDDETLNIANGYLTDLATARKNIEEQRGFFTKPLREHVKRIEALFKPTLDILNRADDDLRDKVVKRLQERREEAEKVAAIEREKAEQLAAKGKDNAAAEHALKAVEVQSEANIKTMVGDTGTVQLRQSWTYEVEDLGAVPHEYFSLDDKAVRAAIKSGVRTIPGLRIFDEGGLAVTPMKSETTAQA